MANEPNNSDHEHVFQEVYLSDSVGVSEETTHRTVTLELFDRGLILHMDRDEGMELARAFTALARYLDD